jgi:hypothetical protein
MKPSLCRRLRDFLCLCSALVFFCPLSKTLAAQEIRILSEAVASPPQGGSHSWYDIEADPENANNLITCGMRWDAKDNANHGFVYSSQDGGETWHVAIEDKHTSWVSEESCAYGVHGVAYFIADASKIDDAGGLHHDQGTTRIYVSHDSGKSWALGTETGWTDFSASVVDSNPGPNQNRLYIFFNNLWTYYSSIHDQGKPEHLPTFTDKVSDFDTAGNTIGLISYKNGDTHTEGPLYNDNMYKLRLHGSYPSQNLLLRDGSLVTLFWSKRRVFSADGKRNGREFLFAAQHTDPQRGTLSDPVIIRQTLESPGSQPSACDSYLSAPAVYDTTKNTIYTAYLDGQNSHCTLMLAESTDNGATWSSHQWIEKIDPGADPAKSPQREYVSLALARNRDGVMSLLWRDSESSDCWNFAISTDDGATYSHPTEISTCSPAQDTKYSLTSASLNLYIAQASPSRPGDYAGFLIDNQGNFGSNHTSGIAVSPDGVFHPAWITDGGGRGQLHSAAIAVQGPVSGAAVQTALKSGWEDITNRVQFLYGGNQSYDAAAGLLTIDAVIRNSGKEALHAPLRLEVAPSSEVGIIYPANTHTQGAAQYWEVGQYLPSGGLGPGAVSGPIPIVLYFVPDANAKPSDRVASLSVRLLAPFATGNPSASPASNRSSATASASSLQRQLQ